MNKHEKKFTFAEFFKHIYVSYIPNQKDNLKQIILKSLFLVSLVTLIVSAGYITNYFFEADRQDNIISDSRELWHSADSDANTQNQSSKSNLLTEQEIIDELIKENSDFKGWITISGTKVDNPIYQAKDNDFYLNRNQQKKYSAYGALYFDCNNLISEQKTDSNLIIYGHEMRNGSMFGSLKKLKSLSFYKQNPNIEFSTIYKKSTYKIYSIFILNASKKDDDGYIYNISRQKFIDGGDFNSWVSEAYERSIIDTGVDVELGDNIITLVTCSEDFENARLVVMAREIREDEPEFTDTSNAKVNPDPLYPKKWYTERGIK